MLARLVDSFAAEGDTLSYESTRTLVAASGVLLQLGEHERLAFWLARVDHRRLSIRASETVANNEAIAWLRSRDLARARAALSKAEAPSTVIFASTDALVSALEGNYEAALSKLESLPKDGALLPTALEIEATVQAGKGEADRAEETLRSLFALCGPPALLNVVATHGPAAPSARDAAVARWLSVVGVAAVVSLARRHQVTRAEAGPSWMVAKGGGGGVEVTGFCWAPMMMRGRPRPRA